MRKGQKAFYIDLSSTLTIALRVPVSATRIQYADANLVSKPSIFSSPHESHSIFTREQEAFHSRTTSDTSFMQEDLEFLVIKPLEI